MSLLRQLVLIISVLFLVVFTGTMLISVNNTRVYLEEQMESHAQDTATSLALSLRPAVEREDWPTVNSMVDAIFDRGYYRELLIISTDGGTLLERSLPVGVEGVPEWFVRLIPLETPRGEALLVAGWKQAGKVLVRSHPGYAYNELWRSAVGTFWWFVASWVVAMALVVVVLKYALAPLGDVERQAQAISDREFPILEKLPWTRELRSVVAAMNKMSAKVKRFITEQVDLTEKIRKEAYRDPVTGIANRSSFDGRLRYLLGAQDEFPRGALFLAALKDFKAYNDRHGLEQGDELLRQAAALITQTCMDIGKHMVARLGGADFAVLAQLTSPHEAALLAGKIIAELALLHTRGLTESPCVGHVGVAFYDGAQSATDLFSEADMALRAAQQKGPNAWHMYDRATTEKRDVHGATGWQDILKRVIGERDITLFFQPVVTCAEKSVMHYEVLARIPGEKDDFLPASLFIPMAERLGMVADFDRLVVEKVLERLRSRPASDESVAVNISPGSVHDMAFADWLSRLLKDSPAQSRRMIFESAEYGCASKAESLRRFAVMVRAAGSRFSLDHFGVGFTPFGYLRDLKLDYIKIDGSLIRGLQEKKDNQFFIHALSEIAHGLDIRVIAESVEDQKEWEALKTLRVDGIQGYLVGEPRTGK